MSESPNSAPAPENTGTNPPKPARVRRRRSNWREQPSIWYVLGGLLLAVLAGGGTPIWAQGIILITLGFLAIRYAPQIVPSRWFEIGLLALMAVALLSAFLPASWLGRVYWREDALGFGIILPSTNAPSPWEAAESFAQLLAGIVWLYFCWNLQLNHESRKYALWGLSATAAILAAGAVVGNLLKLKYPLARDFAGHEAVIFTYFPNRNQSALWYCIGGVAAFGVMLEELRRRRPRLLIAGGLMAPCLLALVMGRSRMALALFVIGVILVVLIRIRQDAGNYALRILLPLGILLVSLLVFFGDNSMRRAALFGGRGSEPEFRLELWRDTLSLARHQPAGVGLGQFSAVFPQYRHNAETFQSVLHPDSDWMWLLGETGWLGVLAAGLTVGALLAIFLGRAGRSVGPYRHLAALCAGLFLLHSLVDVPAHRFGTWLLAGWLIAVGAPDIPSVKTWVPVWAWRVAGGVLIMVGLLWILAVGGLPTNAALAQQRAIDRGDHAIAKGDSAEALTAMDEALKIQPMQWRPYFQRARTELALLDQPRAATADFRRARFVEPMWARVPYMEGVLWFPRDVPKAVAAWREAVQRADDVPEGLWRNIYEDHLILIPGGDDYASALSKYSPVFRYQFLRRVPPARFGVEWPEELQRDPQLSQYTPAQRQTLLMRWALVDGNRTLEFLAKNPNIAPDAWLAAGYALAQAARYREALEWARRYLPPLDIPQLSVLGQIDPATLKANFTANPRNLQYGVALLRSQMEADNDDAALETLTVLSQMKNPPPFVSWQRSLLLEKAGKAEEAWNALQPYIQFKYPNVGKR